MSQCSSPATSSAQEYWISGYGLSRTIVLGQLNYFLGPAATVRPYTFQGREGYRIVGSKLTDSQLADLKRQSREYERQQTIRMSGRHANGEGQPEDVDINTIVMGFTATQALYQTRGILYIVVSSIERVTQQLRLFFMDYTSGPSGLHAVVGKLDCVTGGPNTTSGLLALLFRCLTECPDDDTGLHDERHVSRQMLKKRKNLVLAITLGTNIALVT